MRNKQMKLLYFSLGGTELKEISLGWKKIVGIIVLGIAAIVLLVSVSVGLITALVNDYQVANLSRSNNRLQSLLADMGKEVQVIESKLKSVEEQDDDLRVFVDMPPSTAISKSWEPGAKSTHPRSILPMDRAM